MSDETTQFTPGPWTINAGLSVKGNGGRHIAKVGAEHLDSQTDRANAGLIAAAPEMYEALQAVVDQLQAVGAPGSVYNPALTQARKALAKAKGESGGAI